MNTSDDTYDHPIRVAVRKIANIFGTHQPYKNVQVEAVLHDVVEKCATTTTPPASTSFALPDAFQWEITRLAGHAFNSKEKTWWDKTHVYHTLKDHLRDYRLKVPVETSAPSTPVNPINATLQRDVDVEKVQYVAQMLTKQTEAIENALGLLDNPISRRLFRDDTFYNDVVQSLREAAGMAPPPEPAKIDKAAMEQALARTSTGTDNKETA